MNVKLRPTQDGGRGLYFTGHHEIMVRLLAAMVKRGWGERKATLRPAQSDIRWRRATTSQELMGGEFKPIEAQPKETKVERFFSRVAGRVGWAVVALPIVYGSLLLLGQLYYWLHDDVWVSLPANYLFVVPPLPRSLSDY